MRPKRWTEDQLRKTVPLCHSYAQVIRSLGLVPAGGNYNQIAKYIQFLQLDTSHFTGKGWNIGRIFVPNKPIELSKLLVKNSTYHSYKLKKRLFKEGLKTQACELCGWAQKSEDGRIPVELDHINGNHLDNRFENLRILCPNCHSLQTTHRGRNKVKYKLRKANAEVA